MGFPNRLKTFVLFVVPMLISRAASLKCIDGHGVGHHWMMFYNYPRTTDPPQLPSNTKGMNYAWFTGYSWIEDESFLISDSNSALSRTLTPAYDNPGFFTNVTYNDQPPAVFGIDDSIEFAHAKGIFVYPKNKATWKTENAIWITHSIPEFGSNGKYEFPGKRFTNAQAGLCISFKLTDEILTSMKNYLINTINVKRLENNPLTLTNITYDLSVSDMPKNVLSERNHNDLYRATRVVANKFQLMTDERTIFDVYSKADMGIDMWNDLADELKCDLLVQTWRDEIGDSGRVTYARNITLTTQHGPAKVIKWQATAKKGTEDKLGCGVDHSKWAVGAKYPNDWVCVGDLNRRKKETKKGGTVCFNHRELAAALRGAINRKGPMQVEDDEQNCVAEV